MFSFLLLKTEIFVVVYHSDMYEGTRSANRNDVRSIEELLRPLEENGVLVHRSREQVNFSTIQVFGKLWWIGFLDTRAICRRRDHEF